MSYPFIKTPPDCIYFFNYIISRSELAKVSLFEAKKNYPPFTNGGKGGFEEPRKIWRPLFLISDMELKLLLGYASLTKPTELNFVSEAIIVWHQMTLARSGKITLSPFHWNIRSFIPSSFSISQTGLPSFSGITRISLGLLGKQTLFNSNCPTAE